MKRVHRSAAQGTEYGELLAGLGAGKNSWKLPGLGAGGHKYTACTSASLP